jgi:hypothetical protein
LRFSSADCGCETDNQAGAYHDALYISHSIISLCLGRRRFLNADNFFI